METLAVAGGAIFPTTLMPGVSTIFSKVVSAMAIASTQAMKPAFIEQGRVDLRGGAVLKTLLMKTRQHGGLFVF